MATKQRNSPTRGTVAAGAKRTRTQVASRQQPNGTKKKAKHESTSTSASAASPEDPFSYFEGGAPGAGLASEAIPGALPMHQNTPQKCPLGLFAEQLNGSAFTAPRATNFRNWVYRLKPSAAQPSFAKVGQGTKFSNPHIVNDFSDPQKETCVYPNRTRWKPFHTPGPANPTNFVQGLRTVCGTGSPALKRGMAVHIYTCNESMTESCFCNSDGDMLIVPQQGALKVRTEYGWLRAAPGELCVVQRGIKFAVHVEKKQESRGYVAEVYDGHFKLPDLGPIGANGLANARDFQAPKASFEDRATPLGFAVVQKFIGELFVARLDHSAFDVVAWHGNYIPYKYNMKHFNTINSVSYDHIDPSIFTVLTCAASGGGEPGVACCDFAIFPPRWAVQENTFRPPYYHMNCMSEFMGNVCGSYDAKPDGFLPGGASLHSVMTGHGPDADSYEKNVNAELKPVKMPDDALAFMFESTYIFKVTKWALEEAPLERDYTKCWAGVSKHRPTMPEQHECAGETLRGVS